MLLTRNFGHSKYNIALGLRILDLEDNTNGTVTDFDGNFTINIPYDTLNKDFMLIHANQFSDPIWR